MFRIVIAILPVIISVSFCAPVNAQPDSDTTFIANAAAKASRVYHNFIKGQTGLYVGSEYQYPDRTNQDHPFYQDFDWVKGAVDYDGEQYNDVYFLYDLVSDVLVTEHYYGAQEIALVKSKISSFRLGRDEFVHVREQDLLPGLPAPGFYQLLYTGESRLLARHVKLIEEKIEGGVVERYFRPKTRMYLLKDGSYHRVSTKGDLFRILKHQKQALRSFASREKIKITKGNAQAFARLIEYYDSLK